MRRSPDLQTLGWEDGLPQPKGIPVIYLDFG